MDFLAVLNVAHTTSIEAVSSTKLSSEDTQGRSLLKCDIRHEPKHTHARLYSQVLIINLRLSQCLRRNYNQAANAFNE